ncbi:metallophosphoesterase [Halosquirtibacter laminarini]|uniref:Metallophosphoesterase n=1 Tax=Halosquirtibacter laminarini TaxID=3374600 RepID=A0AC61NCG5_9BACT|nr:metallophosphoesterase [Prolixibacteraceae bacterium]
MRFLSFYIIFVILFISDIYSFRWITTTFTSQSSYLRWGYWALSVIVYTLLFYIIYLARTTVIVNATLGYNLMVAFVFAILLAKILMSIFFLLGDVFRLGTWIYQYFTGSHGSVGAIRRYYTLGIVSLIGLLCVSLLYGVVWGKYNFKLREQVVASSKIPKSFDGFKIIQLSDMHLGTFDRIKPLEDVVSEINQLSPDLILFTGDLVNFRAEEARKYVSIFSKLSAKYGKYTIMGNHDYENKRYQNTLFLEEDKEKILDVLEKQMGFHWLKNSSVYIQNQNDSIVLGGVENWGKPPFPQLGDVQKAFDGIPPSFFKVLMSHDPSYWDQKISKENNEIDLTLSGHTHGMQFGIEVGNFKWSPVQYVYPLWVGLYKRGNEVLYVNRGFGSIGYPGRVGIWPEITLITLKHKE